MNSLILSPDRAWGFKAILSAKLPAQTQSVISEFLISNLKIENLKSQMVLICGVGTASLPLYACCY
jgi:hypothetical protein